MRLVGTAFASVALAALLAGTQTAPGLARAGAYLRDLVRSEPYRGAWTRMLAKEHNLPGWIKDFAVTGEGANTQGRMVPVGHQAYLLATLCMGQDCAGHKLYVLFTADAGRAYGEILETGKAPRWLGKPDAASRAAINEAQAQ
jgi:Inhibitor of vertebrate lysozyme (Ivy)